MTDLLSMVVTVQAETDLILPQHLGRAVHALLLRWVAARDASLARQLHDSEGQKPFTCSTLIGLKRLPQGRGLPAGAQAWFRLTALRADVANLLLDYQALPPRTLELDEQSFRVVQVTSDPQQHPWASSTDIQTLASPYLLAQCVPERTVRLNFSAPTTFRQADNNLPLPLPDLVIGSLADKWNAFSAIALGPELREYARLALVLHRFKLHSGLARLKDGGLTVGGVGFAEYKALRYDRYWLSLVNLLADYALYAGVGRLTTQGLGQARRITADHA